MHFLNLEQNEQGGTFWNQREAHELDLIAISIISVEEQLNGWYGVLRRPLSPKALADVYQRMTRTIRPLSKVSYTFVCSTPTSRLSALNTSNA